MSFIIPHRPRRLRVNSSIRNMVQETLLTPHDFVLPLFIREGQGIKEPISSLPGVYRLSPDQALITAKEAYALGIQAVVFFPAIEEKLKNPTADESFEPNGLVQKTLRLFKDKLPEMTLITDVAMDPYSSDGHDGLVRDGQIVNDETVQILCQQALSHAKAGADIVAPSDMMDGRIGAIRMTLEQNGFTNTGILSYSAKYASKLYGPFREALNSAPKFGDKKTYQMNPANVREALKETMMDINEGADIIMVKPATYYLDIIEKLKSQITVPVAAYHVSGEYAMVMAAHERGWIDGPAVMMEALLSIKRAGADMIFSYYAIEAAKSLR